MQRPSTPKVGLDPRLSRLGLDLPVVQAPMAGVSTPALASAVSNAGGLGSLGVGAIDAPGARELVRQTRALTSRALNVNVFCHAPALADAPREARWLAALAPAFGGFGAAPPPALREIYRSFLEDDDMLEALVETAPEAVSFHFGLPQPARLERLRRTGALLIACVTSLEEAKAAEVAGVDALVAQGWEAGGHRGVFDPRAVDDRLGTVALTRLLVSQVALPVIAAGGIMDGAGVAEVLRLGAAAAQLGTAFVACPESAAGADHRAALTGPGGAHTVMTAAISGRPARCAGNAFTALAQQALAGLEPPDYPRAYDAGKALAAAARARGETGFGAHWAGEGAPRARALPAAELMAVLARELAEAAA